MSGNKYLKYLFLLFAVPLLLFVTTNFPTQAQTINTAMIDQEITKISQIWDTASSEEKATLGLADMLLYSAKERLTKQPVIAEELYTNAKSIIDSKNNLGNPAYLSFKPIKKFDILETNS